MSPQKILVENVLKVVWISEGKRVEEKKYPQKREKRKLLITH